MNISIIVLSLALIYLTKEWNKYAMKEYDKGNHPNKTAFMNQLKENLFRNG